MPMTDLRRVHQHFQKNDPKIFSVLQKISTKDFPQPISPNEYFQQLCRAIIGQQLSGKVADVIGARFTALFPQEKISAEHILKLQDQQLRDVGMSWAKVRSIKDLAEKTARAEIKWQDIPNLSDEKVIAELVKIKGIGRWTAEMFLLFSLGREDIFSFGDLGLKKGFMKVYKMGEDVTTAQIEKRIAKWSPYKSYASLALWKALDG
jgi:DNA-3-methyladenine glycosylase II